MHLRAHVTNAAWAHYGHLGHATAGHGMDWFGHTVVSSLIHGVIYAAIFRIFAHMSIGMILVTGGIVLFLAWLFVRSRQTEY